jgi:regulator of sirC expression with transglutaminase-like and TPR domain
MSDVTRRRLARVTRRADSDLAEAALCVCAEADPGVDIDAGLLRLDALADGLRTRGGVPRNDLEAAAASLRGYLAGECGFSGNVDDYYDPANGLLTSVLDRRQGLPITLSILYVAIARRLDVPAWGIAHPGHYYVGLGTRDNTIVLDPFHGGEPVTQVELAERISAATAGQVEFTRAHLRSAGPALTIRRLLNNLTRDYSNRGAVTDALWTVDLKLVLPNSLPDDHRVRGDLLTHVGRYDEAADEYERYLDLVGTGAEDAAEIQARAIRARAKLN